MNKLIRLEEVTGEIDPKIWDKVRDDLDIWVYELDDELSFPRAVEIACDLVKGVGAQRYLYYSCSTDEYETLKIELDDFKKMSAASLRLDFYLSD